MVQIILWWALAVVAVLIIAIVTVAWWLHVSFEKGKRPVAKPKPTDKGSQPKKADRKWVWDEHPKTVSVIFIVIGIITFNLVIWKTIPWLWDIVLQHDWWRLIIFDAGLGLALFFSTIKSKDKDGKEAKPDPTASKLATVIVIVLVLGLATTAWNQITKWYELKKAEEEKQRVSSKTTANNLSEAPVDVALPIIAGCETGNGTPGSGHQYQFQPDGSKIPVKNPTSSATGKYQIMSSLHRKRAESLGFDIDTLEGNEGYARVLYSESGTAAWEVDPRSKACWEPQLAMLGYGPTGGNSAYPSLVEAPVGKPSREIRIDPGVFIKWDGTDPFVVENQKGLVAKFDPVNGIKENLPYPSTVVRFKSSVEKPVEVKLTYGHSPLVKM